MRTGLERKPRATREYQPTNRRVNQDHPPPPLHLLAALGAVHFEVTFEEKLPLPVDILSAISTAELSDAGGRVRPNRQRRWPARIRSSDCWAVFPLSSAKPRAPSVREGAWRRLIGTIFLEPQALNASSSFALILPRQHQRTGEAPTASMNGGLPAASPSFYQASHRH